MKLKNLFQGFLSILLGFALILNLGVSSASAATRTITLEETGQFEVPANNEDADVLVTPGSYPDDYQEYIFTPVNGMWSNNNNDFYDCLGGADIATGNMTYTNLPAFSLVAESVKDTGPDGRHYAVCATPDLSFFGDDEIKFVMNDSPGGYYNNVGSMIVKYKRLK